MLFALALNEMGLNEDFHQFALMLFGTSHYKFYKVLDHVIYSPPTAAGGNKPEGLNKKGPWGE